jgi:rhamnogalacturonyl hydrolase YesR
MGVGVAVTSLWDDRSDTTAKLGMLCVARYENTGDIKYRDLMHAAADAYFDLEPDKVSDVSPMNLGHAISLQVAAWRSTAQPHYLNRARYFGDWALKTFFDAPLPRASVKSNHYEAITGADTLALALVDLHLNILGITAVRCPSNTIDR